MEKIQILAAPFFQLLKDRDTSMWEIFSQMITGTEKELIFLDAENKILFNFILPKTAEELEENRKQFSEEFAEKLKTQN